MSLADQAALATNNEWAARVRMAVVNAALQVKGEARQKGFKEFYEKRSSLADIVLGAPVPGQPVMSGMMDGVISRFCWAVAANPAINWDSTDGDLAFTVNSVWNDLAGINADEAPDNT
jgi:hypothetical protein